MGHIKKLLAIEKLPPRSMTPDQIWTDLCENVHLHYRNVRFDFSENEWALFRSAINHLGIATEHTAVGYRYEEGDPNFLVQQVFETPLSPNSDYYHNRSTIELNRDGTVHFHYRDLRLHFSLEEFRIIAGMFIDAEKNSRVVKESPFKDITEPTKLLANIDDIQPYDEGHRPGVFDEEHRDGIEYCKGLINSGKAIRPILVAPNGQRMDGFKRYMAHKELGFKSIWCIVDPVVDFMGKQHGMSMEDNGEDVETNLGQQSLG